MKGMDVVFALFALAFGTGTQAVEQRISQRLGDLTPYAGTYIDWSVGGVSMEWDAGPVGDSHRSWFLFHTYDASGAQINWIGQPTYVPTSQEERLATGVIGHASGELYYAKNGPCIGCAPRPAEIVYTGIQYKLEWTAPRTVRLTFSGARAGQFNLTAVNFASTTDDQFLAGTWAGTGFQDLAQAASQPVDKVAAYMAVLNFAPMGSAPTVVLDPNAPMGAKLPPVSARYFTVSCAPDERGQNGGNQVACGNFFLQFGYGPRPQDGYLLAWYDPVSQRGGLEAAKFSAGAYVLGAKLPTGNWVKHVDLYVAPDVIRGRNEVIGADRRFAIGGLTMVRLPSGTVRSQYDYPTN